MRKTLLVGTALMAVGIATPALAGTNDLFEAKTATTALKETSNRVLSSATAAERKAMDTAAQASRDALKAYGNCPSDSDKAAAALEKALRNLERHREALAEVPSSGGDFDALADFDDATAADVAGLAASDAVCDDGHSLTQDDLDYVAAVPFVSFAPGWGDRQFGAHGTFGDFAPESAAPDHVHGETYYGVVIGGLLKNPFGAMPGDDIGTATPLPAGSFWSVPANAIHTTACDGGPDTGCLFYFHSRGAFDFDTDVSGGEPADDAAQEIPVDEIAARLDEPEAVVSPFAHMVTLWGDRAIGAHGTMGEFIPDGTSPSHSHSYSYHGVVLSGTMVNPFLGQPIDEARPLEAGDYWFVPAGVDHVTACISAEPCSFYFHSEGLFDFIL